MLAVASVCLVGGCDINGMLSKRGSSSKSNAAQMLREAQEQLPHQIDEHTTLVKIEKTASGNLDFWYVISDEIANRARRIGRAKIEEYAKKRIDKNPDAVALAKEGYVIHHIYENRYGTHLFSFTVSPEALHGEDTVGKERSNPFAVRNVSRKKAD